MDELTYVITEQSYTSSNHFSFFTYQSVECRKRKTFLISGSGDHSIKIPETRKSSIRISADKLKIVYTLHQD